MTQGQPPGPACGPDGEVTVVVPNFNGAGFIGATLDALDRQIRPAARVLVVDNGSTDRSVELLRQRGAEVLVLGENTGFAGAANAGLAATTTPLLAVLNSDARPRPDWLSALAGGPSEPDVWAWGSVQLRSSDGMIESAGDLVSADGVTVKWRHGTPLEALPATSYEILAPPGAAPLLRADAVRQLGGWWDRYFLYYEDIDLALRARLGGWRAVMVPSAVVEHDLARSSDGRRARWFIARNSTWCAVRSNPATTPTSLVSQLRRESRDARRRGYLRPWTLGKLSAVKGLRSCLRERRSIMEAALDRAWTPDDGGPPGVIPSR